MGMHTEEMACTERYRASRRAGLLTVVRRQEERAMEGMAIAHERVEADLPELAMLRGCHQGLRVALVHLGAFLGDRVRSGDELPLSVMLAQSEVAGVGQALAKLLQADVVENRDQPRHRPGLAGRWGGGRMCEAADGAPNHEQALWHFEDLVPADDSQERPEGDPPWPR